MKNLKKILAVICVLALVCVGVVLTAIAEDAYTGTVEELEAKIADIAQGGTNKADTRIETAVTYLATVDPQAEGLGEVVASLKTAIVSQAQYHINATSKESDTDTKIANIGKIATLLGYLEIDETTAGYTDVVSGMNEAIVSTVSEIADSIEFKQDTNPNPETDEEKKHVGYWNTMDVKIALNKINGLIKKGTDVLATEPALAAALAELEATYQEKRTANMELAEAYATIEEYKYGVSLDLDFSKGNAPNYGFDKMDNYNTNKYGIEMKDGNPVFTVHYASPSANTYPQVETPDGRYGIVCEFDFTTFGQLPGGNDGFNVSGGGQNNQAGLYCDPLIFGITSEGALYCGDRPGRGGYQVIRENVITPGEWVHLAYVFNYSKQTFDIYFEYELVGSSTAKTGSSDSHASENAAPIDHAHIRPNASTDRGEFSIDNFKVYRGSAIRTDKKIANMTTDEKFIYLCEYILDNRKPVLSRNNVYNEAGNMLATYYNEETGEYVDGYGENPAIVAAVANYYAFDLNEAIAELRRANRDEFISLIVKLEEINRTLDTTAIRMAALNAIIEFLDSAGSNMEQDDIYTEGYLRYEALEKQLGCDIGASNFILSMQRFATAPTLVARQKHLDSATALKFDENYPLNEEYYDSCFNITYDADGGEISREVIDASYDNFVTEYNNYDEATFILEEYVKTDISKKIVTVIELIREYDTVEEWQANYDYINEYILILRGYVKDSEDDEDFQAFDTTYEGINDALAIYTTINTWFYGDLQSKHIAKLEEQLGYIRATDSYIVKMGVCATITKYLATEDIDFKNEDIKRIVTEHGAYVEELEYRKEDYTALLEQNAYYFNTVVTKLSLADGYTEIVDLYEEATTYYFALDANVEGTREMMAIYDSFTEKLDTIKKYSEKFIESMNLYALVDEGDRDEKFNALVTCYYYSQYAEEAYEGVAEKLAAYEEAYDAYMSEVAVTNSELSSATAIMASSRANNGNAPVVSVILGELEEN